MLVFRNEINFLGKICWKWLQNLKSILDKFPSFTVIYSLKIFFWIGAKFSKVGGMPKKFYSGGWQSGGIRWGVTLCKEAFIWTSIERNHNTSIYNTSVKVRTIFELFFKQVFFILFLFHSLSLRNKSLAFVKFVFCYPDKNQT